jgi:preprotein translocase SecE subunit
VSSKENNGQTEVRPTFLRRKKVSEAIDTLDNGKKEGREGVGEFIRNTREELDKTTFPSSEDVRNTVIIVIVNVIFFALYLFLIDHAWTYILEGFTWVVNKIAGL